MWGRVTTYTSFFFGNTFPINLMLTTKISARKMRHVLNWHSGRTNEHVNLNVFDYQSSFLSKQMHALHAYKNSHLHFSQKNKMPVCELSKVQQQPHISFPILHFVNTYIVHIHIWMCVYLFYISFASASFVTTTCTFYNYYARQFLPAEFFLFIVLSCVCDIHTS